ncbi:Hsp20/alpha crystallin family protein [Thermogemmatispora onikobensis]|uniref:Hsp20/alpha crystallin family protein n=1 Tax=Thermogemmatispora onikobensis TaxID=732234 RepID=UPI00085313BF|nr:Hsp20/alpha crystallin family protein [Thermogemmatispora onikobensis]
MTTMVRFDPWREMMSLREAMDRLFEQTVVRPFFGTPFSPTMPLNVYETDQGYQVQALLPGVKPEDIDLTVQEHTLTIKARYPALVDEGKQVNWLLHEIGSGEYVRSITFAKPIVADQIETHYEHGLLTITVPVSEASRPKRIAITAGQPEPQKELAAASTR